MNNIKTLKLLKEYYEDKLNRIKNKNEPSTYQLGMSNILEDIIYNLDKIIKEKEEYMG